MTASTADTSPGAFWDDPKQLAAETALYAEVRARISGLHSNIQARASTPEVHQVGKDLGILQGKVFVFDSEEETAVFSNHLYYFSRFNKTTPAERYLKSVNRENEDEVTRLAHDAIAGLRYTFLEPMKTFPGVGVVCRDGLLDTPVFLADKGFSRLSSARITLATGLFPLGRAWITTGAALPLPGLGCDLVVKALFEDCKIPLEQRASLTPAQQAKLARLTYRFVRQNGLMEKIRYE